ncbi:xanthine dehydrogenase family protein molybdopterin-binding subunit [Streptosporangium sp. NPDC001559]|uniref:xanthine dehydrogenase family protein molybdopterin-binding subunit n=1 Tax=Streptosporangium sp. NPDC001559 TaxID=3366187 RepID=UPI0036ECF467
MTERTAGNDRLGTLRGNRETDENHATGRGHGPQGRGRAVPADLPRNHEADEGREVGRARRRKEDARLVTGRTTWTDNIRLPGMLYVAFLRAPMAHARITRVDTSAARSRPGVVAAFRGQDFAGEQGSLPCAWPVTEDVVIPDHPPMAVEKVRYVGEAVACVVATDRYAAADALEDIEVDYEPLAAVVDMTEALTEGSPKVHETGNRAFTWRFSQGDVEAALRDAPVVVDRSYVQQRLIPTAMEPRAVVATTDGDSFTLYSATQIPHVLRVMLAMTTGIPEHRLRVIAPDVGGGFGSKLQVTAEEVLALLLTRRLGRPVKWTESRSEGNLTVHHGRDQLQRIRLAAERDGRLRAVQVELLADMGAYLMLVTPGVPLLGAFMYGGIYKMDAYDFTCTGVFTTKMPTDAYRGAGRPEATFAIERAMDELAHELGLDPIEVRRRNWITHEEFPYTTVCGLTYDSGNYEAATDRALELFGYDALRAEQARRRAERDPVQLGIGVSTFTEMCGIAPSRVLGSLNYGAGGWEHASVRVLPTGKVEVVTGTSPHGQGHETAWSQIAADALGVPFEDVSVLHGDTAVSHKGMDTYGSRSLVVGGVAVLSACEKVKDRARELAAHMLEASTQDVEFADGSFRVRGTTQGRTIQEVALAAFAAHDLPDGVEPGLDAETTFDPENFSFPHGTHLCAVEVDTETGGTVIRSYVAVDDVGSVVNPLIVEGQVHGGIAQGVGQALFEEAIHDVEGNLLTTTMADYLIPSAADLPEFVTDRTETPATSNPLGVKGVGEAGTIASTPAVVNAVVDALRPYGVHDVRMPCTPERVWRAMTAGAPEGFGASRALGAFGASGASVGSDAAGASERPPASGDPEGFEGGAR